MNKLINSIYTLFYKDIDLTCLGSFSVYVKFVKKSWFGN